MIKNLKHKFILICVLSAFLSVILIVGAINIFNYYEVNSHSDQMINMIIDNKGLLPKPAPPKKNNMDFKEQFFEARFFIVSYKDDNSIAASNTENVSLITSVDAAEYGKQALLKGKNSGYINTYKYKLCTINGNNSIAFLDCSKDFQNFISFFETSLVISIIAIVLIFVVSVILSPFAIRPIKEAYEKQSRFITNASHELKTPLTIIGANTDILAMGTDENKWIKSTKTQVARLSVLISRLVSLSRMDENTEIVRKKLCLSDIVSSQAESFDALALENNKSFTCSIQKDIYINGDEKTLTELINIILDNAFKYSDDNGKIDLSLSKAGKSVILEITNTAENIKPGNHSEFFDRFYRGDESHSSEIKGFGIGLSLAHSIVDCHKGKISARSSDGKSITLKVTL